MSVRHWLVAIVFIAMFWIEVGFVNAQPLTVNVPTRSQEPASLPARLSRPDGNGPFEAVVLLHGCGGIWDIRDDAWTDRLLSWGYVVLQIDSFGPRGYPDGICKSIMAVSVEDRVIDAHSAKDYLNGLPYVKRGRVAVMGMSHGGWTTLESVENSYLNDQVRTDPFKAAIALYPPCPAQLYRLDAPLLILIGEADDWTYSFRCENMGLTDSLGPSVTLKVYPDATHAFDADWPGGVFYGHTMKFDPEAARDAVVRVESFLKEHLNEN